jgi:hypothetical protein
MRFRNEHQQEAYPSVALSIGVSADTPGEAVGRGSHARVFTQGSSTAPREAA